MGQQPIANHQRDRSRRSGRSSDRSPQNPPATPSSRRTPIQVPKAVKPIPKTTVSQSIPPTERQKNTLIKRSGYGFRNFENFRIRCLLSWHFI